jgi:hypothetical protein
VLSDVLLSLVLGWLLAVGSYWGVNGFFKIERGMNALHIESDCAFANFDLNGAAVPANKRLRSPLLIVHLSVCRV